jgi:hypothetical protein
MMKYRLAIAAVSVLCIATLFLVIGCSSFDGQIKAHEEAKQTLEKYISHDVQEKVQGVIASARESVASVKVLAGQLQTLLPAGLVDQVASLAGDAQEFADLAEQYNQQFITAAASDIVKREASIAELKQKQANGEEWNVAFSVADFLVALSGSTVLAAGVGVIANLFGKKKGATAVAQTIEKAKEADPTLQAAFSQGPAGEAARKALGRQPKSVQAGVRSVIG